MQKQIKGLVQAVFYVSRYEEGLGLGEEPIARFGNRYPSAMARLGDDPEQRFTCLRFPAAHHKAIRTTYLPGRFGGKGRNADKGNTSFSLRGIVLKLGLCQPDISIQKLECSEDDTAHLVGA